MYNASKSNWICKKVEKANYISSSIKDDNLRKNLNKSSIKSATKLRKNLISNQSAIIKI